MTAKQTLDKLRKLLEFKQSAAWTNLMYYEETYGEDSVEAKKPAPHGPKFTLSSSRSITPMN